VEMSFAYGRYCFLGVEHLLVVIAPGASSFGIAAMELFCKPILTTKAM
jgi:hypothetical protein